MKVIGSYPTYEGEGDGLDRNYINVPQGKINFRQIIRDNYPNPITNTVSKLTRGCERMIIQANKAFGVGRLTRKEGHDTVFAACVGTELTETLCDELELEMTIVSPAPLQYTDTRKRSDVE